MNYIRETFSVHGLVFEEMRLLLIGDNVSSNRSMADICILAFVMCYSHKLNLEMRYMIEMHPDLHCPYTEKELSIRYLKF